MPPAERARVDDMSSKVASLRSDRKRERQELELARSLVADDVLATRSDIEIGTGWLHFVLGDSVAPLEAAGTGLRARGRGR